MLILTGAAVLASMSTAATIGEWQSTGTGISRLGEAQGARAAGVTLLIDVDIEGSRRVYNGNRSARFANAVQARRSCIEARGTFSDTAGRLRCRNPRSALRSAEGDIIVTGTRIPQPNL